MLSEEEQKTVDEVSEQLAMMGHRGCCGVWVGKTAEDLLYGIRGLKDVRMLNVLLTAERNRQKGHGKRSRYVIHELERRLWTEKLVQSEMIDKVQVNKAEADIVALNLVNSLAAA